MTSATIIAVTQPLITADGGFEGEKLTPDQFIAYAARVSNPENQSNTLTAPKLIKYLIKNRHFSPFQMVNIVMEVTTTRDISRQLLRHEFKAQEHSTRYADPTKSLGFVTREGRLQDTKNRQNSLPVANTDLEMEWQARQDAMIWSARENYNWAVTNGIAKEQARAVLPEGLVMTRLYAQNTLRGWMFYCQARGPVETGTQKEHRQIAKEAWKEILKYFPSMSEVEMNMEEDQ